MKVLIVDDEKQIVNYLQRVIPWDKFGFQEVKGLVSSKEALVLLTSGYQPDLLITDIKMPEVSGLDLVQAIDAHTRAIIISGYSEFEYAQQAIRYGVKEYLLKPIYEEELEGAVTRLIAGISAEQAASQIDPFQFYLYVLTDINDYDEKLETMLTKLRENDYEPRFLAEGETGLFKLNWQNQVFGFVKSDQERLKGTKQRERQRLFKAFFGLSLSTNLLPATIKKAIDQNHWNLLVELLSPLEQAPETQETLTQKMQTLTYLYLKRPDIFKEMEIAPFLQLATGSFLRQFLEKWMEISVLADSNEGIVRFIQGYVNRHYQQPLSLEILGELVHLHPVYLSRMYKETTNENLSTYILTVRLEKVRELLINTDFSLKTIAELVGYRKPQNVIDLFKRKYSVTPAQYRNQQKSHLKHH